MRPCRGRAVPVAFEIVTLLLLLLCLSPCTVPFATFDVAGTPGASHSPDGQSLKDKVSSDALAVPTLRALVLTAFGGGVLPAGVGGPAARQNRLHTILRL
jgi:hypothetical protein